MFKLKQALDYLVSLNPLFHHFSYLAQHLKKVRLLKKAKHLKDFQEKSSLYIHIFSSNNKSLLSYLRLLIFSSFHLHQAL